MINEAHEVVFGEPKENRLSAVQQPERANPEGI